MRTFLGELRPRHLARLLALLKRHKAGIGYLILTVGVVIALALAAQARREVAQRVERQAGVICQNTVRQDRQSLANLYTKSGHELFRSFHLTIPQARVLIHRNLVQSADSRRRLQPSIPRAACTSSITTLARR